MIKEATHLSKIGAGVSVKKMPFYGLSLEDLKESLSSLGKAQFRAQQIFKWVYEKGITDPDSMTNLSKKFRAELPNLLDFSLPQIIDHKISQDDTQKFLFDVGDGLSIESVLIPSDGRLTLCVSSEVGCNLACKFCFTGKRKLKKRLSAEEIVAQFVQVTKALKGEAKITNVVFMGMGEPLDNPDAVFKAIDILHSPWGLNVSRKKITVSTSGLVEKIPLVTQAGVRLAVSLNATTDETRSQIMPINFKHPIDTLLHACRTHAHLTKDRVTIEYVLLKDVTDSLADAKRLARIAKSVPSKINIIPFNEHEGADYTRPNNKRVERFRQELMNNGVHVLLRKTMGRDIYAACGQLTSKHKNRPEFFKPPAPAPVPVPEMTVSK